MKKFTSSLVKAYTASGQIKQFRVGELFNRAQEFFEAQAQNTSAENKHFKQNAQNKQKSHKIYKTKINSREVDQSVTFREAKILEFSRIRAKS